MNPIDSTPLLRQTLRATAFMLVPIVAFLAILSAVALYAIPSSNPSAKEEQVVTPLGPKDKPAEPTSTSPPNAGGMRVPGSRALVRPNKI
jgi:hypothetical protein